KTSKDRYLTTFVGSFIRPPKIVEYNQAIANGEAINVQEYEATLKQEVAGVVKQLAGTGLDVISDGEFGKPGWLYITNRLTGFEMRGVERPKVGFRGWDAEGRFKEFYEQSQVGRPNPRQAVCVGPVTYTDEGRR